MEGILRGTIDASVRSVRGTEIIELQLNGVQGEPVSCWHFIEPLAHSKAEDQQEKGPV